MTNDFVASTQYNDLTGTAALDGHEGPGLMELARLVSLPEDYFPIGFSLFRLNPDDDGMLPFQLIAVKKSETGDTMEKVIDAAKRGGKLTAYSVEVKIDPKKFPSVFKRCEIKVLVDGLDQTVFARG